MRILVIVAVITACYFFIHWAHPYLTRRRQQRVAHGAVPRVVSLQAPLVKDTAHPAFRPGPYGAGLDEQQRSAHFPAYRSIRDLDQGRKLEVGEGPLVRVRSRR